MTTIEEITREALRFRTLLLVAAVVAAVAAAIAVGIVVIGVLAKRGCRARGPDRRAARTPS